MDWPSRSPDLNPIENLWHYIKVRVRDTKPNNLIELEDCVLKCWNEIDPAYCKQLIKSMPRRITACIAAKGGATKY